MVCRPRSLRSSGRHPESSTSKSSFTYWTSALRVQPCSASLGGSRSSPSRDVLTRPHVSCDGSVLGLFSFLPETVYTRLCQRMVVSPYPSKNSDIPENMSQNTCPCCPLMKKRPPMGCSGLQYVKIRNCGRKKDLQRTRFVCNYSSPGYRIFILTTPGVHACISRQYHRALCFFAEQHPRFWSASTATRRSLRNGIRAKHDRGLSTHARSSVTPFVVPKNAFLCHHCGEDEAAGGSFT